MTLPPAAKLAAFAFCAGALACTSGDAAPVATAPPGIAAVPHAGASADSSEDDAWDAGTLVPCNMGETASCTCEDTGAQGISRCYYEPTSPTGGYLGFCMCDSTSPPPPPMPSESCPTFAPEGGECPSTCTGGCAAGTCIVDCSGADDCTNEPVACPDGWPCEVRCAGAGACSLPGRIRCADGPCDIRCTGYGACADTTITCDTGSCSVACGPNAVPPHVDCADSCDCTETCVPIPTP